MPVDHRQGDRDRGQRHQPQQRPVEPRGRAEQRPRHGRQQRAAPRETRPGGDVGVEHLGGLVGGWRVLRHLLRRGLRHARDQPRDQQAAQPGEQGRDERGERRVGQGVGHGVIQPALARRKGAFACFSQHVDRDRQSGEQLDLQHRLVHEEVQATDDRPVRSRGDEGRGPRVVQHVEDDRHVRAARDQLGRLGRRRDGRHHDVGAGGPGAQRRHDDLGRSRVRPEGGERLGRPRLLPHRHDDRAHAEVGQREPDRGGRRTAAEDRRRRQRGRRALTDGGDRPGQVGVVADPGAVVLEHQRVDGTGQARPVGEPVDQRQRLALEGHGQREPAPLPAESRQELPQVAGADPVGVVGPVQSQLGVRRPVQRRRQRVGDRVAQHAAAPARPAAHVSGLGVGLSIGRRSRSRSCTRRVPRGSRRSPRRTWSRPSRGRP